jgi:hypothetical protein
MKSSLQQDDIELVARILVAEPLVEILDLHHGVANKQQVLRESHKFEAWNRKALPWMH